MSLGARGNLWFGSRFIDFPTRLVTIPPVPGVPYRAEIADPRNPQNLIRLIPA
jgi:hypothetical protein